MAHPLRMTRLGVCQGVSAIGKRAIVRVRYTVTQTNDPWYETGMLYIVVAHPNSGGNFVVIQDVLEPACSWHRVSSTAWVICTDENASAWNQRLAKITQPDGSALIARLDVCDRQGWATKDFWDWLRLHAGHVPSEVVTPGVGTSQICPNCAEYGSCSTCVASNNKE